MAKTKFYQKSEDPLVYDVDSVYFIKDGDKIKLLVTNQFGVAFWHNSYTQEQITTILTGYALASHTHLEANITDLDKYTQAEIDNLISQIISLLSGKSNVGHTHLETDITDLDKYTQAEVDTKTSTIPVVLEEGTTRLLSMSDSGKIIRYTNALGCVVTIPDTLTEGFNALHIQKGAVVVSFIATGTMVIEQADGHTGTAKIHAPVCTVVEAANIVNLNGYTA